MECIQAELDNVPSRLSIISHAYIHSHISYTAYKRHFGQSTGFLTRKVQGSTHCRNVRCSIQAVQAPKTSTIFREPTAYVKSTTGLNGILQQSPESSSHAQSTVVVDAFAELHSLLEKEIELGVSIHRGKFSKEETKLVMEKLRETRKQGMKLISARRKQTTSKGQTLAQDFSCSLDPQSLVQGDFVVHKSKGIGRFIRLNKAGPEEPEYIILQYADGMAKLKSSQASRLLYRYHQAGDKRRHPALSKLNDPRSWEKKKSKSKLAAQKMVVDLLQLYVSRLKQKRQPYPEDGVETEVFASKFPYKLTPDQMQALADIRKDMVDRETPMDRLICGDVGFGKTEVALRAIFRVFLSGKQVMVLAPTTVLARQHYTVICERFADYNARVALLSKFQTTTERRRLAAEIQAGNLDIIVGTHALFNNNIRYNNLGMLVIDEEQKFGVKQKERIASLKTSVDVLTLSATPIPRTLYLALTGFRDASLITTPPPQRLPIKTHLLEFNEKEMVAAVQFELARDGQVYYVLPRRQGLEAKMTDLQKLFPGVTIGVAHGKQNPTLLEETMDCFAQGELRILLCTNIIESGLDIRRVNTIIVEDVHLFGLAQIYQLRGRVGRADKEAHAYFFYPQKQDLSDEALERLVAIEECCELGQGFMLAERDLAIRGFGSVFGEKQSGEAAHIGQDLFFDLLFDTMSKADSHIFFQYDYKELDVKFDYCIGNDYIQDAHKYDNVLSDLEVAACNGMMELMYFTNNLRCDFGRETSSFKVLLQSVYIRRIAADVGIHHIYVHGKTIVMESGMSETFFKILKEGISSDSFLTSLTFKTGVIEIQLLVELSPDRLIDRIFASMVELRKGLSHFAKQ
ncbi:hypothetical protein KP509_13G022800 [Ceratopteris richardii]|uniref:Transcription-repair coupling factor n=1 Tax=Ceratopteris richardii TaxID=49495 RepID=A0A8T2THH5_CERRI|nr:hypothetical protein KP509_13G022800 [Ceratopteris richardii]